MEDLINFGSLNMKMAAFLESCVKGRLNVVVSGGTGSGKTTLLNVLSAYIPYDERIVTIEDAAEIQLQQAHVLEKQDPRTWRERGRSPFAIWCETRCVCARIVSSSARCAAAKRSTCCKR